MIFGRGPRWTKSEKRPWRFEISIFLDRNVVRIRSSIVSNLSKINQIFNLSPNQERFVSLTIWVSTLFLPSNQSHHLACDTDEILFWQTRFLGIYRSWERSENLMAPGGTGFKIKKPWLQIIRNESYAQVRTLNHDIYGNAESSFFQSISRAWICVHFLIQAHFFLADANLEAGLSHAARDARPNTATK